MRAVRPKLRLLAIKTIFGNLVFKVTLVLILGDGQDLGSIYYDRLLTGLAAAVKSYANDNKRWI